MRRLPKFKGKVFFEVSPHNRFKTCFQSPVTLLSLYRKSRDQSWRVYSTAGGGNPHPLPLVLVQYWSVSMGTLLTKVRNE